ncbi:hypothetical protein [Paludisphaera mucosa]|uniref:Verru_Chthon cassette protein A n=1 Tax=Paludisphaera mucosa TaxID=3030827 RepID=A0ABT6F721_9BACT|nr:hypothetical protein [Paludisphaera mucosa]MDG3003329.1 hypothetical protein [Paludisphaera mucosa]
MLTTNRARLKKRRGVALILVLGMLGLLALIGVTFATFSGQARIGARNYAQSVLRPQPNELMDYALSQLIGDTDDVGSAIRGHSMARDMFGNDAARNGYVDRNPTDTVAGLLKFTGATIATTPAKRIGTIECITNIPLPSANPTFYGYDFTRWVVKFGPQSVVTGTSETRLIGQTFEVLEDDVSGTVNATNHVFYLSPSPTSAMGLRSGYLSPDTDRSKTADQVVASALVGEYAGAPGVPINVGFVLDGRALHAFNGPGMGTSAVYANMRYNGGPLVGNNLILQPGEPDSVGMDEDYDACDLENWFLAIQSADGKVIMPSFHRPGVLRQSDWSLTTADVRSKILRPRAADGHDPLTFPNLRPEEATGKIRYDVDNDGDGLTDSVWVDLGYPATRDARGVLFKPLFAFMVIGLNGRIPLNTAGNLQQRDDAGNPVFMHTSHLGNSPSEVDPTFGLQNDATKPQVDDASISVNVTQLRSLLTGTRPDPTGSYEDRNRVGGYVLPNNVPDVADNPATAGIHRLAPRAVPGRWGEPGAIPEIFDTSVTPFLSFSSMVRAGVSALVGSGVDGRDDDSTAFDHWPSTLGAESPTVGGWPADYYDAAGDFALPAERMRRFVTPMDLAGDGKVISAVNVGNTEFISPDIFGRVAYHKYFRPPGVPVATVGDVVARQSPLAKTKAGEPSWVDGSNATIPGTAFDVTNNPLHGFEAFRNPSLKGVVLPLSPLHFGAAPTDLDASGNQTLDLSNNWTTTSGGSTVPTYNNLVNSLMSSAGLNEAAEMSLYQPNSADRPFGHTDLEWLYRAHDQDGASLSSRLSELAPLSFRDSADALRRRRLYSIDTWDTNSITWANDNPGNRFSDNRRFGSKANTGLRTLSDLDTADPDYVPYVAASTVKKVQSHTPSLVQRDRKINLNYPLPVSNSSTEPTRLKWISETYQYLKTILPPLSIDTPEELAFLSQYLVNIVDFRDPDATMTRFVNPDCTIRPGSAMPATAPSLVLATELPDGSDLPLIQYGMEYSPVAINEVLAYSFLTKMDTPAAPSPHPVSRFFIELVNTLTESSTSGASNASTLNLGGFGYTINKPYEGGCWDLIFADETPYTRPDPFTGQLLPNGGTGYYAPLPLNRDAFQNGVSLAQDVQLVPLTKESTTPPPAAGTATAPPKNFYYTIGNDLTVPNGETSAPSQTFAPGPNGPSPSLVQSLKPSYDPTTQTAVQTNPGFDIPAGVLPGVVPPPGQPTAPYPGRIPAINNRGDNAYKWVCLRRPANPFAPVSADNPMIVVDSMRFHMIEGSGEPKINAAGEEIPDLSAANKIYSTQRFQPNRGGHLVPRATGSFAGRDLDVTRYGFTEQLLASPSTTTATNAGNFGKSKDGTQTYPSTNVINNTLGDKTQGSAVLPRWDFLVFHDRDFTSVAELSLVPGCPPGLFTKQFVEYAPSDVNVNLSKSPKFTGDRTKPKPTNSVTVPNLATPNVDNFSEDPRTYPYLVDQLFYTSASPGDQSPPATTWNTVYGPSSGGWFKMFEVFEVPSPVMGAVASAANGFNYDWFRQDIRPGQLNLNLIIDEEVFLGLVGNAGSRTPKTTLQQVVNVPPALNAITIDKVDPKGFDATSDHVPLVVTEWDYTQSPPRPSDLNPSNPRRAAYPLSNVGFYDSDPLIGGSLKGAFSDFLKLRHGSSGYLFSPLPEAPFRSLTFPDINATIMRPATPTLNLTQADHGIVARDAGVRNPALRSHLPPGPNDPIYPPAVPPRRLFQVPDTDAASNSNASRGGESFQRTYAPPSVATLKQPQVNLTNFTSGQPGMLETQAMHPFWRSEWMQKMMNLSTVRTHQYAVWVTVGFFEVKSQGDPSMAWTDVNAAFDTLGREVGLVGGKNVRQRGFFIVDRLKLDGFDASNPGKFREAVLYRQVLKQ